MLKDIIVARQKIIDGITYSYDTNRGKWLSIGRCHISYGINHRSINTSRWLAVTQGIYSNNIGFKLPRIGTITSGILQVKHSTTCKFKILKNEDVFLTLNLDDENYKTIDTDANFDADDSLKCFLEIAGGNKADFPFVVLECASRL